MKISHLTLASSVLAGLATGQVAFSPIATIDLSSTANPANAEFIGSNPSAVAWNGTDLYVAGFNGGMPSDVGIVRVADALGAAAFGAAFGTVPMTPLQRGYTGLDITDAELAAAYDFGAASAEGIAVYDIPTGTRLWAKSARGSSGVAFDPGTPGGFPDGRGVGWPTFSSGRRSLQNTSTGADIWTTADGMLLDSSQGALWRGIDFDDDTGDVYLRQANNLVRMPRIGDNATDTGVFLFDPVTDAPFVAGQNVAFLSNGVSDYVIFNDRATSGMSQPFLDVVKLVDTSGAPITVDWGGFTFPDSVAYYDFAWDAASGTLAILDFGSRMAYLFGLDLDVGVAYCVANVNSTGVVGELTGQGSPDVSNNSVTLTASSLPNTAFGFFLVAQNQGFVQNPGGSSGNLCLSGSIGRYVGPGQIQNTGQTGSFSLALDLANTPQPNGFLPILPGQTWNYQAWYRDSSQAGPTSNFTRGLFIDFL